MWFFTVLYTVLSFIAISTNFAGLYIIGFSGTTLAEITTFTFMAIICITVIMSTINYYVYKSYLTPLNSEAFKIEIPTFYFWVGFSLLLVLSSIFLTYIISGGDLSVKKH